MGSRVVCCGIESTAHTYGIGIVDEKGNICADQRATVKPKKGGIIPTDAANHHEKVKDVLFQSALTEAGISEEDIDIISFSQGPGLSPSLSVGLRFARALGQRLKRPVIGVNHLCAHIEIGKAITRAKDPVCILVTGANTQMLSLEGGRYRVMGESLDVGLGNALDKFGRCMGIPFPAGPVIEELAKKGAYVELPYTVKGMDTAFAGLVTKCESLVKKGVKKEDLCFSFQETAFAMMTEVAERALAYSQKKELLLIGGVAANQRLSAMMKMMCKERKAKCFLVGVKYAGDNGVMIAQLGIQQWKKGKKGVSGKSLDIKPAWRLEDVDVTWEKK